MYEPGEGLANEETNVLTQLVMKSNGLIRVVGLEKTILWMNTLFYVWLIYIWVLDGKMAWFIINLWMVKWHFRVVTSFVHLDDAVETSIQAIHFENGIYNVADDAW